MTMRYSHSSEAYLRPVVNGAILGRATVSVKLDDLESAEEAPAVVSTR